MLPKAIKYAMIVVLSSYELVNVSYYILLPWDIISSNNAVAVTAAARVFGNWAGICITILIALSCCGSITGNVVRTLLITTLYHLLVVAWLE